MSDPHHQIKLSRSEKRFAKGLLKYEIDDCKMIVDVGCGSGWLGEALKEYLSDPTIIAIDIRPQSQRFNVHFAMMDVRCLGLPSESFDLIIAKDTLEHLSCPILAMEEFARMLKKNGKLIITVPLPQAPFLWDDYTHVRPFTKVSLSRLLEDSGFEIVSMKYLAISTIAGGAFLRIDGFLNSLANLGFRRGNILAVGRKKPESTNAFNNSRSALQY